MHLLRNATLRVEYQALPAELGVLVPSSKLPRLTISDHAGLRIAGQCFSFTPGYEVKV